MAESRTQKMMLAGGALAALAASACCLGPLALVLLGLSGAWIANLTTLEPYRPIFIGAALVLMGLAWRRIYRTPAAEACAPGTLCALPQNQPHLQDPILAGVRAGAVGARLPVNRPVLLLRSPPC